MKDKKSIQVVAGIIWSNDKQSILIAKRPEHLHKGGYWEFPGGKIELGETAERALQRELYEELTIRFSQYRHRYEAEFSYPEKTVYIQFFDVWDVTGSITSNEGQEWRWVNLSELSAYTFPEANQFLVNQLIKDI